MKEEEFNRLQNMMALEKVAHQMGYTAVAGVDEAGRGPLAGDVYAAAVILPPGLMIEHLNDSKKLTAKRREQLYEEIKENALAWSVATATPEEIDAINILNASFLAMRRAIDALAVKADFALIDGNAMRGLNIPYQCVIKGDALSQSIAAASVMAKVSRDRYMEVLDSEYPGFGFAKHKGYPTKAHYQALRELGASPVHRKTFLKKLGELPCYRPNSKLDA